MLIQHSVDEGLPQSQVYDVHQSARGYLWVATRGGGAARFDGNSYSEFTTAHGLPDNVVYDIAETSDGAIWMATSRGVARFDGRRVEIVQGLPDDTEVYALAVGRNGAVWAGSERGLFVSRDKRFVTPEGFLPVGAVRALLTTREGELWVGTAMGGLLHYKAQGDHRGFSPSGVAKGASVEALAESEDGTVWIGTTAGIVVYDGERMRGLSSDGLPHPSVRALLSSRSGRLWVGTDQGAAFWNGARFEELAGSEVRRVPVWGLAEDHEGSIHFGTSGRGFVTYAPSRFLHIPAGQFDGRTVWSIAQDKTGTTWFGLEGGLMRLRKGSFEDLSGRAGVESSAVRYLFRDRNSRLVVGTREGVGYLGESGRVTPLPVAPGHTLAEVRQIAEDSRGRLIVATNGFGAFRMERGVLTPLAPQAQLGVSQYAAMVDAQDRIWLGGEDGLWIIEPSGEVTLYSEANGLPDAFVLNFHQDRYGSIWAGTHGGGLVVFDPDRDLKSAIVDTVSTTDGLSDPAILFSKVDREGGLWIGTNHGLNRIDLPRYHEEGQVSIDNFGHAEGYTGIEANLHAAWQDEQGRMWFGDVGGVSVLNPSQEGSSVERPLTQITGLRIKFDTPSWEGALDARGLPVRPALSYADNHLTFDFVGLSYKSDRVVHRYRLLGFENSWSPAGSANSATYSNLPSGDYTFEVQSSPDGEIWPDTADRLSFLIKAPFWATWWFRVACLIGLAALVHAFVTMRTRSALAAKQRLVEIIERRTGELQDEMDRSRTAMDALRASEEQFRYLVENVNDVIFSTTPDGQITYISPAVEPIVGVAASVLVGEKLSVLLQCDEEELNALALGKGKSRTREYRVGEGAQHHWLRVSEKATIEDGEVIAVQGVLTDITRQKGLERRLAQAGKLESIGQLAAGIAHEINTPVQFVSSNTSFLQECVEDIQELGERLEELTAKRQDPSADLHEAVGRIEAFVDRIELAALLEDIPAAIEESLDGLARITEIVGAMKEFSHPGAKEKAAASIERVARSSASVSRNSWKELAEVEFAFPEDMPLVPCVASELSQVFLNLIVNSAHAMEGLGREGRIVVSGSVEGDSAVITIEDNGCGMPEEVRARIFDPFFTTKGVGKGTGQGLSIARDVVVSRHGGHIEVESEPGRGTRFIMHLPLTAMEADPSRAA